MRTEDLKRVILRMSGSREFYGYEVQKELEAEEVIVGISRLYRVLTEMLRDRLLEGRWERGQLGPQKRVYRLSEKGRKEREKILLAAIDTVHGFYSEYLLNLPGEANALSRISKITSSHMDRKGEIAFISLEYSVMHEKILSALHGEVPEAKIYFVKPVSLTMDLDLVNLYFLDGNYDSVPLRDDYVDLLIVVDVPKKNSVEKSLKEWRRVLRQRGTLAIITPTILVHEYADPLSIGNFIEKYEHKALEKGENVDAKALKLLLREFFHKVQEKQFVDMTIFLASELHFPR